MHNYKWHLIDCFDVTYWYLMLFLLSQAKFILCQQQTSYCTSAFCNVTNIFLVYNILLYFTVIWYSAPCNNKYLQYISHVLCITHFIISFMHSWLRHIFIVSWFAYLFQKHFDLLRLDYDHISMNFHILRSGICQREGPIKETVFILK